MVTSSLMLLSFILSVGLIPASHAKDPVPITLGKCDPSGAVKTLDAGLKKGKSLNDSMTMVIQSKQCPRLRRCIYFIRRILLFECGLVVFVALLPLSHTMFLRLDPPCP